MVIDEKPYSLSWFLTPEGILSLSVAGTRSDIKHEGPKLEDLSEVKIGEDGVLKKKPLTILDFLRKDYGEDKGNTE